MEKIDLFIQKILRLRKEPLYMNSLYMMASTAMVSGSGFFLWMIAARLYSDAQVGLATALVSVIGFIMSLSILGFNYSIIRFLPKSKNKSQLLSTSILIVGLAAVICAGFFLSFLQVFSPQHMFIRENPLMMFGFLVVAVAVVIDFATEAIFLALRQGKYLLIKNIGTFFLKLLLPVLFAPFGAFGLFMAWALSISSAIIISSIVLSRKFGFKFTPSFRKIDLRQIISFSSTNYIVSLTGIAPALLLPLVIANTINAESAAYFYISFMIANLLYTIPYAATQSLFAEGSHNEKEFITSFKKALKLIGIILLPGILFLLLFGNFILLFFGSSYSTEGVRFLQLLAIAGIPMALNLIGLTFLNIHKKMKPLLSINIAGALAIIVFSYFFREYALTGIGIAWLVGNILKTILYSVYIASFYTKIQLFKPSITLRG
jgi:O-antigen/teichoic acid export membrane protein